MVTGSDRLSLKFDFDMRKEAEYTSGVQLYRQSEGIKSLTV